MTQGAYIAQKIIDNAKKQQRVNEHSKNRVQLAECTLYHGGKAHNNAEEKRVGKHCKYTLRKLALGSCKEYKVLTNK